MTALWSPKTDTPGSANGSASTSSSATRASTTGASSAATSATWRRRTGARALPPLEDGLALLHERGGRLPVVLGEPGADVVGHLHVEALPELAQDGPVEVLLHVAVGDPGAGGQPPGDGHGLLQRGVVGVHRVEEPEPERLGRAEARGQEVQLPGLGRTHQPGEEPGPPVVAGEPDPGEGGGDDRALGRVPQV